MSSPIRVAVVGAGPSGFYTAGALLGEEGAEVEVDIFDRLPAPYGLVRYGVAPDHPKIKSVERVFSRTAADPRIRFLGNVSVGSDITRDDLLRHYHQVVYAVGSQTDRRLGISGEDLDGSYSSTDFVYWYNAHPDYAEASYHAQHESVAVVGIGNVAIDVVRVLGKPAGDLAATDIYDVALDRLRESRVKDLYLLARRGPVQAKCSPAELKELAAVEDLDVVVSPRDLELDEHSKAALTEDRNATKNMEILSELAAAGASGGSRRLHLRFLVSPTELLGEDGKVTAIRLVRNRLEPGEGGYLRAVPTDESEVIPATMVIRAVGYRSVPLADVPFDDRRGLIPNDKGRVLDPETGTPMGREYAVGWVKRGPSGLIGSNKGDGIETAAAMVEDLASLTLPADAEISREAVDRLLRTRGIRPVTFEDWERLNALELSRGEKEGRPRVKFARVHEMMAALKES